LKLGDKIFWGLVVPNVLLGMFIVWPYLDVSRSRRYAHRRFGLSMMLIFLTIMLFLSYMGTPKYGVDTAGDQEIAQALAPVEGVGPLRALPYDAWVNGTYCTDNLNQDHQLPLVNWGAASAPVPLLPDTSKPVTCQAVPEGRLHELMETYKGLMDRYSGKLPNAVGVLNVVDNQTTSGDAQNTKRIDIQIIWNLAELDVNRNLQYETDANGQKAVMLHMVERAVDANGTKQTAPAIQTSGKQVFVNHLSEYHSTGE